MAAKGSNIAKEVGRFKFNYRHANLHKGLKPMESESPQRTSHDAPVVPSGGHKRCLGEYDQDALELGLSQSKRKLKMRRGPIIVRVCKNTHCNGTKCQVYCERATKRPRAIDNSCLPTDSYTNAELQSALQTQNLHKDTPLLTALRYRHLDRLEEYLRRLKVSDAEEGTDSLKKILAIQNEAYDTCLTLAARDFYSEGTIGNPVSSLASTVQLLLDYCSSFPEIVMIRSGNGLTAIHLLLNHVPTALNQSDTSLFTLAESMVTLCPNVLTVKSRKSRENKVEEYPFEQLNRKKAEVAKELLTNDSVGAAALTRFSDCLKYLCIKHDYDLGVLYKVGEEPSLALDLTDYAGRSISYRDLNSFQRPKFDAVLQFISIPHSFEVVRSPSLPTYLEPKCHHSDGRHKHYEWYTRTIGSIFHWLHNRKTIRTILHVQVEDLGEGCDCILKLMENSLWIYQIETWEWKRYNVPISIICNATRQRQEIGGSDEQHSSVRDLNLYWRGEPESFPGDSLKDVKPTAFPKLQLVNITIYYDQSHDENIIEAYKERVDMYLKTCQENLCQSFLERQMPVLSWSLKPMPGSNAKPKDIATLRNDPSDPTDDFLDIMYKWGRFLCSAKFQSTRPITVAILDDGFDLTRPSIKENFKGTPGVSFQPSGVKHYKSGVAVGYKSHGTIMAYCVKQMFPQVRILPIRIKTGDRRNTASQSFSPFDVIEALEFIAKLEYHVDIVNMSWTIEFPPSFNPQYSSARGDNDETYKLYSKLQNAMNVKKIILLCATSDKGRNAASRNVPVYPGAFGFHNPDILTIGSASSDGDRSKPAYTPVHFIFPGERVTLEPDLGEASGSSVATAIASGMAASILFLVDLVERERDRFDGEVVQRDKVTTSMIRDAFTALDGSPTQTLEVLHFRRELGEMCKINGFEADGDRLSRRWLAMSKRLLRILGLATY